MNTVTILFFATLRDRAGAKTVQLDLPEGAVVSDLKSFLSRDYPNLGAALDAALVSINHKFAFPEDPVPEGAEVALFPAVSGG